MRPVDGCIFFIVLQNVFNLTLRWSIADIFYEIEDKNDVSPSFVNKKKRIGTLRFLSSFTIFCCVYQGMGL
ncbi:hypothetical protein, partial [Staphylococcus delphini]